MTISRFAAFALAAALLAAPSSAAAPDTIKARQDNFKAMARSMKLIGDELRKDAPAFAIIRREAAALERAGGRVGRFFPKGTGPEAGVKTRARAAIWAQPAEFRLAAANSNSAIKGLRAVASGTDVGRIRAALRSTGGACAACHDTFRVPE